MRQVGQGQPFSDVVAWSLDAVCSAAPIAWRIWARRLRRQRLARKTEVADAHEALWQDMEQEAAQQLRAS
jgi:hypothetical protein